MVPGVTDKYVSYVGIEANQLGAILERLERKRPVKTIARDIGMAESEILRVRDITELTEFQRTQSLAPSVR